MRRLRQSEPEHRRLLELVRNDTDVAEDLVWSKKTQTQLLVRTMLHEVLPVGLEAHPDLIARVEVAVIAVVVRLVTHVLVCPS